MANPQGIYRLLFKTGTGPKQNGAVECLKNTGENLFIEGNAIFIEGMGIKFVEDYKVK